MVQSKSNASTHLIERLEAHEEGALAEARHLGPVHELQVHVGHDDRQVVARRGAVLWPSARSTFAPLAHSYLRTRVRMREGKGGRESALVGLAVRDEHVDEELQLRLPLDRLAEQQDGLDAVELSRIVVLQRALRTQHRTLTLCKHLRTL